jgi:hypothetical protein
MKLQQLVKNGDNSSAVTKFMEETYDIMISKENFDLSIWKDLRTWQNVIDIVNAQWAKKISQLEKIFGIDDEDLKSMKKRGNESIAKLGKDMQMLGFNEGNGLDIGAQEIQMEQQVNQEKEQETEQELEQFKNIFNGSQSRVAAIAKDIVAPKTQISAFEFTKELNSFPLGKRINDDKLATNESSTTFNKKYESAKNAFPSKINNQFFGTNNFFEATNKVDSVFSDRQKSVDFLLISWNKKTNSAEFKCHFLANMEADQIRKMIGNKMLTDCHLCSTAGVDMINGESKLEENDVSSFKERALCMAHLFYADISWINTNYESINNMIDEFTDENNNGFPPRSFSINPNSHSPESSASSPSINLLSPNPPSPNSLDDTYPREISTSPISISSSPNQQINSPLGQNSNEISPEKEKQLNDIVNFLILRSSDPARMKSNCKSSGIFSPIFSDASF